MKVCLSKGIRFPAIPFSNEEEARKEFKELYMEDAYDHFVKSYEENKEQYKFPLSEHFALVNPQDCSVNLIHKDNPENVYEIVDATEEDTKPKPLDIVFQGVVQLKDAFESQLTEQNQKDAVALSELDTAKVFMAMTADGLIAIHSTDEDDGRERCVNQLISQRLNEWRHLWLKKTEKAVGKAD